MQVILERLILFNFKSFKGEVTIGPIKPFTAIIGANGSGKSNIMDAISFVMGEKARALRVKQLQELIHGASIGMPIAQRAYVAIVFAFENNSSKTFKRSIHGSESEYKINEQIVTAKSYMSELEKLNLNVKVKNFLVFQGTIESIVMKSPKEYTQMFEEISNSVSLKANYERLKNELSQAENEAEYTFKKKKDLTIKKKYALLEKTEADKYKNYENQYINIKTKLHLFELYHIQTEIDDLQVTQRTIELQINEQERDREIPYEFLRQKNKQLEALLKESEKFEKDVTETENAFRKIKVAYSEIKEKIIYWQNKINSANSMLGNAYKCNETHIKTIQELENELMQVEEMKTVLEENMATQLLSQGSNIELNEIQVQEYFRLKQIVEVQSFECMQHCSSLKREQSTAQNKLDKEDRKKAELKIKLHQNEISEDEIKKHIKKIQQNIQETEVILTDKIKEKYNLESMINKQKENVESIQSELAHVSNELGNATVDKESLSRLSKQQDTLKILQNLFTGVYGRLYNVCRAVHSRYDIALTKVFGKHCNSIVVSTNKVAMQCISYLREQRIGIETFLPLESLKAEPIKEALRGITEPKNVKLLYDVVVFSPMEVERAILFVTRNTLVCETPEDARMLAYNIDPYQRGNCVSLDGTYYTMNGIISGGETQLFQKAKIWQEKDLLELKSKKVALMERLRERFTISKTESEINVLDVQIRSTTNRLNYFRLSLNDAENKAVKLQNELHIVTTELDMINNNIAGFKETMVKRNKEIQSIEENIRDMEDIVFERFCRKIGISNIRRFEQGDLRIYQEQANRRFELEEQCNRIENLLEFEKSRDTRSVIYKLKENIGITEQKLRDTSEIEVSKKDHIEEELQKLNYLRAAYDEVKSNITEHGKAISECRQRIAGIDKEIASIRKKHLIVLTRIEKEKAKCHAIIKNCKAENIILPLLEDTESSNASDSTSNIELRDVVLLSRIDFSTLPEEMKSGTEENIRHSSNKLNNEITDIQNNMDLIKYPNFKAVEKINTINEKLRETNTEHADARNKANSIKKQYEKVKEERYDKFMQCLNHVTEQLDIIYRALTKNDSVSAIFLPDNPEEPYLGGINYSCIAPGKRFQPLSNLSGGEKTVAALALLFAIHSFAPAPFFILDEVDAALDNLNIKNAVDFIRSKTGQMQFILISLKEKFYSNADGLIGVCLDCNGECPESLIFTMSLKEYLPS